MGGKRTIGSVTENRALNKNDGDNKRNCGQDVINFSEMTLRQLQKKCKAKKRKLSKSVSLRKQDIMTFSNLKQDYSTVQPKEEEFDYEESLGSWKSKLPKKLNARQKCSGKHVFSSSKPVVSVVVTEKISSSPQDSLQNTQDLHGPINIKIEISEPDPQNLVCFDGGSTSDCSAKVGFSGEISDGVSKIVNGSELETKDFCSSTKETPTCVVNRTTLEYLDHTSLPVNVAVGETIEVDFSKMTSHGSFASPVSELKEESNIILPFSSDSPSVAVSLPNLPCSKIYGKCENYSSLQEEVSIQINNSSVIQIPDMAIDDSLRSTEFKYGDNGYVLDMVAEASSNGSTLADLEPDALSNSNSHNCHPCLNPCTGSDSTDDGSRATWKKLLSALTEGPASAGPDEARECPSGTHPFVVTEGHIETEMLENHHDLKVEFPKRLLSARKAISPISREKLRKAADAKELHDDIELSRSGLETAVMKLSSKHIIKKQKYVKIESPELVPKSILKVPQVSCAIPHAGTECTSIHAQAQKAVAFSRRQMHDIDCLATKLMEELKLMKDIVKETECSEVCPSASLKYSADEIRAAVNNATELEETTRKWLSMMAKDCSRFCKIMSQFHLSKSSTKKASAASGYMIHKEKRKIIFADETGGMLCDVKVFEDFTAPVLNSETEKPETS